MEQRIRNTLVLMKRSFALRKRIIEAWLWVDGRQPEMVLRALGSLQFVESVITRSGLLWLLQQDDPWILVSDTYKDRRLMLLQSWVRIVKSEGRAPTLMGGCRPIPFHTLVMKLDTWIMEQSESGCDAVMVRKLAMTLVTKGCIGSRFLGRLSDERLVKWFPESLHRAALGPLVLAARVRAEMECHHDTKRLRVTEALKPSVCLGGDGPLEELTGVA